MCYAEPNLATDQTHIRCSLNKAVKQHFPTARIIPSASPIPYPSSFKPGGTLLITTSSPTSRITKQGSDHMGRWSYVLLATKQSHMICIVTLYRPCKQNYNTAGPFTVHRQQWTLLREQGILNPLPRDQFDQDLINFIQEQQSQGHHLIISGDFNGTKSSTPLFEQLYHVGLRDVVADRHFDLPSFRTY